MTALHKFFRRSWLSIFTPVLALIFWDIAVQAGWLREAFFPRPSTIWTNLLKLLANGSLQMHFFATIKRIWWTFLLAAVPGIIIGLVMGLFKKIHSAIDPVISLIYPIPSVLFLPLAAMLLGLGEMTIIIVSAITAFFLIVLNTAAGVKNMDNTLLAAGVNFGAKGWKLFVKVILPASLPFIFTGLRLGLGFVLIVVVAAEIVATKVGLGALLWLSWQIFRIQDMYVSLLVLSLIGLIVTYGLEWLGDRLMPWRKDILGQKMSKGGKY